MIEVENIWRSFSQRKGEVSWVLRGVSFRIQDGETIGILGGNGSGKSTLLRVLSTLDVPDQGSISWNNQPVRRRVQKYRDHLCYCSGGATGFYPRLSGLENINLMLSLKIQALSPRDPPACSRAGFE